MSSAEVSLGARLYLDAVSESLPDLFKSGGAKTEAEDYRNLRLAFRDMSRQLVRNDAVRRDEDGNWQMDDASIAAMDDTASARFLPYYETVVMAHEKVNGALVSEGHKDYVASFRALHEDTITELEPETVTRVKGEDMQAIAGASLSLLGATREDPARALFLKGLDRESLDTLWNVLETSNYLMPGENPDREAPIGEQALRGTPEQQEALFYSAAAISANLDLPETLNAADKPATRAHFLRNAVARARTEEVDLDGLINASPDHFFDSDLTRADANSLFNLWNAGATLVRNAQFETQSLGNLLVADPLVDDVRVALADYDDKGIENALTSGNFEAPGIDADAAERIASGIGWLREAVETRHDDLRFTGDDGGALTQEGATMGTDISEFDNAFDGAGDDGSETVAVSGDEDMAADRFGKSDNFTRLNESMVAEWDSASLEMLGNGTLENLRLHAGRAEIDPEKVAGGKAAFATFEDAMGADRVVTGPEMSNRVSDTMSKAAFLNVNPDRRGHMRTFEITEGRSIFEGFKAGGPGVAAQRMTRFLDDRMVDENGKPNLALRNEMHKARTMPIVGPNEPTARAFRDYAEKFVERDREEFRLRTEVGREKRGATSFDLEARDVARFIDVAEASGSKDPARVTMDSDGLATLSHSEAPRLRSRLSEVPTEIRDSDRSRRPFGGQIEVEQIKAAYQTGADRLTVMMDGERPCGVIAKVDEEAQKSRSKPKRIFEDVVLS